MFAHCNSPPRYIWARPPSTNSSMPVMKLLSSEEECGGFRDFVRASHSAHRHAGYEARLYLLALFLSLYRGTEDGCVDRTRADGVDSDLALLQINCPCASERPHCGLRRTVNT